MTEKHKNSCLVLFSVLISIAFVSYAGAQLKPAIIDEGASQELSTVPRKVLTF